jgi:hypothetical protein
MVIQVTGSTSSWLLGNRLRKPYDSSVQVTGNRLSGDKLQALSMALSSCSSTMGTRCSRRSCARRAASCPYTWSSGIQGKRAVRSETEEQEEISFSHMQITSRHWKTDAAIVGSCQVSKMLAKRLKIAALRLIVSRAEHTAVDGQSRCESLRQSLNQKTHKLRSTAQQVLFWQHTRRKTKR